MRQGMDYKPSGALWWLPAVVICCLLAAAGCERKAEEPPPDPPSVRALEAFLKATKYRDVEGAFEHHVESSRQGVYCQSKSFQRVLKRTRQRKTAADCRDVRALPHSKRSALKDDAELLVQILRFVCEHPDGGCVDYAREVFATHLPTTTFWKSLGDWEIRRVKHNKEENPGRATVYLDIRPRDGGEVQHRSIQLRRVDGRWLVGDQFGR